MDSRRAAPAHGGVVAVGAVAFAANGALSRLARVGGAGGRRRHRCGLRAPGRGGRTGRAPWSTRPSSGPPAGSIEVLAYDPRPVWNHWWRLVIAVPLRLRGIRRVRNIDYWGDGNYRHKLDVLTRRGVRARGGPGARLHPRRGLGHRRQAGAGHPDDARARPAGLGVRLHQLPPEPPGHLAGPHRGRQAGGGLGPSAHRRVRRRSRVRRRLRGIGRGPPLRPAGPHPGRPRVAARLRGPRHLGRRLCALLRRVRPDRSPRAVRGVRTAGPSTSWSGW